MNNRRRITGVVTSNKMTKTVVVEITRVYRHPLYKKVVRTTKRVMAHDELGCQVGDEVRLVESRPLSRRKRWVVETVLKRAERNADSDAGVMIAADAEPVLGEALARKAGPEQTGGQA